MAQMRRGQAPQKCRVDAGEGRDFHFEGFLKAESSTEEVLLRALVPVWASLSDTAASGLRNELPRDVKKKPQDLAGALSKDRTGCGLNRRADSASELLFQSIL